MELAVDLARRSVPEHGRVGAPLVGSVAVLDDVLLSSGFRGETGPGRHAEFCMVSKASQELAGATVYTTLEPCTRRNDPKIPCVKHLIDARVMRVFIGSYDPDPAIYRLGWKELRDAGIERFDFPSDLRDQIDEINSDFLKTFRFGRGREGAARFDPTQNGGEFIIVDPDLGMFITRWRQADANSVWAVGDEFSLADSRYAEAFDEIHDVSALRRTTGSIRVSVGEVTCSYDGTNYVLVRVTSVSDRAHGDDRNEVSIEWQTRLAPVS